MKEYSVQQAYEAVEKFNNIADNLANVDNESVNLQLSLIFEELSETIAAFENKDCVELLDGAVDIFVTTCGLLQKLSSAGFNVNAALKAVCDNNLSKFPKVGFPVRYDEAFSAVLKEEHQVYVIKDSNGKIRKPSDFVPVNLLEFTPDNFFTEPL